jgi:hypothetical protein
VGGFKQFGDPKVQARTETAFEVMSSMHKHPIPMQKPRVEGSAGMPAHRLKKKPFGEYCSPGAGGTRITIYEKGTGNEAVTAIHEYGHHLDCLLGNPRQPPSLRSNQWSAARNPELMRAFQNSTAMSRWRSAWQFSTHPDPRQQRRDAQFFKYVSSPHEMFARAYAQWVAMHGGNRQLRDEFTRRRDYESAGHHKQTWHWTDQEFKPIAAAMEAHFRKHGLL